MMEVVFLPTATVPKVCMLTTLEVFFVYIPKSTVYKIKHKLGACRVQSWERGCGKGNLPEKEKVWGYGQGQNIEKEE